MQTEERHYTPPPNLPPPPAQNISTPQHTICKSDNSRRSRGAAAKSNRG
jgi:hypothetical protein